MNYLDLYSSYPDETITSAWNSQLEYANKNPWLNEALRQCGKELFARFEACYADLRALPRGARRRLQRRLAHSSDFAAALPECLRQSGQKLQHRMACSLAGAALLLALGQGIATAATITVTTSNANIAADGQCSLTEAINNANDDALSFPDCPAGTGPDTIVLPANANVILSSVNGFRYGQFGPPLGLPLITSPITIEGNSSTIARDASAPAFGLIGVRFPGSLTFQNLTLHGGSFGGISNDGTLSIKNSTISGNSGIGVYNIFGSAAIENSTIAGNTGGGGILNYGGRVTIANSTISGNTAITGGGISNCAYGSSFTISNSTISGNIANQGGGISNGSYCGFYNYGGATLSLNNSLVVGNQATVASEIENVTDCPSPFRCAPNTVKANSFNLFGTNGNAGVTGFTPGPTDIVPSVSLAQILGPLKNNGGPTKTHALVAGSRAIDAGNPNGCRDNAGALLPTDQRGFHRNVDGNNDGTVRCDIGAVEFGAGSVVPVDFDGDGKSDIVVYETISGNWFVLGSSAGFLIPALNFGGPGFIPVPGDYDGDGEIDPVVYDTATGNWFRSIAGVFTPALNFGGTGFIPVPGDYDGDGKTDVAVYQQSNGNWFVVGSTAGFFTPALNFGGTGFIPVPGDYDADGKTDLAVYQQSTGNWFAVGSTAGFLTPALNFGGTGFIPVPEDYDGDGKTDVAVYQQSTGNWFVLGSSVGFFTAALNFGGPGFIPVPGDYDGDGEIDSAVYQTSTGNWFVVGSTTGFFTPALNFGGPGFVPVFLQVTILRAMGLL